MRRAKWWWRWTPTPSSNPDTISRLVRWFADPKVGAVAGNAKVGNRINMITRWQALEYIVAQNLERRALVGAGHADRGAGRGRRLAARCAAASWAAFPPTRWPRTRISPSPSRPRAIGCCSIPPPSPGPRRPPPCGASAKQRFRWAYGTLQCLWKYRRITFNPDYGELGLVALPQVWLFQILLTTLAPVADLLLVWQLVGEWINYAQHGRQLYRATICASSASIICVFMVVDLLAAMVGFVMEKGEDWQPAVVAAAAALRLSPDHVLRRAALASWTALRGPFVGWGKLERHGTVKARA